jgi:hypothetical protein
MKKQKQEDFVFAYVNRDSQRLRETFFSDDKEKTHKDNWLLLALTAIVIFFTVTGIIFSRYDLFLVKKTSVEMPATSLSLLSADTTKFEQIKGNDVEKRAGSLYMAIPAAGQSGFRLPLLKTYNLTGDVMIMYVKSERPLIIDIIAKDTNYFSNAFSPFLVKVEPSIDGGYKKVSFELKTEYFTRVNLSLIDQLTFYFRPLNNEGSRVFVKDIILAQKE